MKRYAWLIITVLVAIATVAFVRFGRTKVVASPLVIEGLAGATRRETVVLHNRTLHPVTIYGSRRDCGTPRLLGLPTTLGAWQRATFEVEIQIPAQESELPGIVYSTAGEVMLPCKVTPL